MPLTDDFASTLQRGPTDCGVALAYAACKLYGVRYNGAPIRYYHVRTALHTNDLDGTDPRTLEAFFRAMGLRVLSGEMATSDLYDQTAKGRPVLCAVKNHWVAVLRVTRAGYVIYHDPSSGRARMHWGCFSEWWTDQDRLGAAWRGFGLSVWQGGED